MEQVDILVEKLKEANASYRKGNPIMTDPEFDRMVEELQQIRPDHPFLSEIGFVDHTSERKRKLPFHMASMNKIKNIEEFLRWLELKDIPSDTNMILTAKYDGISLTVDETFKAGKPKDAWTRGDGQFGEFIPEHFAKVEGARMNLDTDGMFSYGELIMSRKNFEKYDVMNGGDYMNARNLVSGKANDKIPSDILKDCDYIRYGIHQTKNYENLDKDIQLKTLEKVNKRPVPFKKVPASGITEEMLYELFSEWNSEYELDGIIIEVNNYDLRKKLGTETSSGNPVYARAFKGDFEDVEKTECTGVSWQVSKKGHLKPVVHINPVKLNGAIVTNIYGDNGRWMAVYGIGEGSKLKVKRSGMVIPRIINVFGTDVADAKTFNKVFGKYKMDNITQGQITNIRKELGLKVYVPHTHDDRFVDCFQYPESDGWDGVELKAKGKDDTVQQQRMVAFFEVLDIENISDKTVEQLWDRGYKTIKEILELKPEDMRLWDGWGDRKAEIFYESIHSKLKNVPIEKAQHASGFFYGLGSKKLALVKHFTKKPTMEQLVAVEGFNQKSAEIYLNGLDKFWSWIAELPITLKMKDDKPKSISKELEGWAVVFTGFRSKEMEEKIILHGGEIKSGISKNSTHLIMKEKGSGTTKEKKALDLGQKVHTEQEMKIILQKLDEKYG